MAQGELTKREGEVVQQLLTGKSNKLIASSLHISERTVEFHLKNIYDKYQVSSRMELVLKLGDSTVADQTNLAENRDHSTARYWANQFKEILSTISKEIKMNNEINAHHAGGTMSFFQAIRVCLTNYAEFNGQASRPEFWWFFLFVVLVAGGLEYLHEILAGVFLIAMLLPFLAAGTRRLRDAGKSGWWQLFLLAPVGGIIALGILWALPSIPADHPSDDPLAA